MKKGLIGLLIASFILVFAASSMAADWNFSGLVEFGVMGTTNTDLDLVKKGKARLTGTVTSGAWSAQVWADPFDAGKPLYAHVKWTADAFALTMSPILGLKNNLYDLGAGNLSELPGVRLDVGNFYVVANKPAGVTEYNFGGGVNFTAGALGLGVMANSEQTLGPSTSFAGKVTYTIDALALMGQVGSITASPTNTAYLGQLIYTLAGGSSLKAYYLVRTLNEYSKIYGKFTAPLAEAINFIIEVFSETDTCGSKTTYKGFFSMTL